jgi:hypothetical protein
MKKIELTQGYYTIVDDEDFEMLNKLRWKVKIKPSGKRYAEISRNGTTIRMHRFILNLKTNDKKIVDHINGDGLDNRRSNLRICTSFQNQHNRKINKNSTSGYKGVYFEKGKWFSKRWAAQISVNNKHIKLGYFETAEEAARAYNEAAIKYHGEFANINEI